MPHTKKKKRKQARTATQTGPFVGIADGCSIWCCATINSIQAVGWDIHAATSIDKRERCMFPFHMVDSMTVSLSMPELRRFMCIIHNLPLDTKTTIEFAPNALMLNFREWYIEYAIRETVNGFHWKFIFHCFCTTPRLWYRSPPSPPRLESLTTVIETDDGSGDVLVPFWLRVTPMGIQATPKTIRYIDMLYSFGLEYVGLTSSICDVLWGYTHPFDRSESWQSTIPMGRVQRNYYSNGNKPVTVFTQSNTRPWRQRGYQYREYYAPYAVYPARIGERWGDLLARINHRAEYKEIVYSWACVTPRGERYEEPVRLAPDDCVTDALSGQTLIITYRMTHTRKEEEQHTMQRITDNLNADVYG